MGVLMGSMKRGRRSREGGLFFGLEKGVLLWRDLLFTYFSVFFFFLSIYCSCWWCLLFFVLGLEKDTLGDWGFDDLRGALSLHSTAFLSGRGKGEVGAMGWSWMYLPVSIYT
jgi:hypothetical protein